VFRWQSRVSADVSPALIRAIADELTISPDKLVAPSATQHAAQSDRNLHRSGEVLAVGTRSAPARDLGLRLHRPAVHAGQEKTMAAPVEPIRVVVVDDQQLFRRGLTMLLSVEEDIEVVGEAGDGVAAAELAGTAVPDVILMDVRMPKRSGIEACASIKEVAPTARIIMLTVSDEEADLYDAVKNGASGYLLKDSSIDEVAQAIRVVADGQSLISPSMAIKLLDEFKQMSRSDRQQVPSPRLTERELEVLKLVAQGLNNREIAKRLFISENTVKNHVRNILEKLQLHSRMEAVMYAVREKLLDIP
jgi:two-component system NarL family response regulator